MAIYRIASGGFPRNVRGVGNAGVGSQNSARRRSLMVDRRRVLAALECGILGRSGGGGIGNHAIG